MNQAEKTQQEYDEIDLMDYVKVLSKRKWLILTVFLVVVIGIAILSFFTPKVYKIDTSLEIGQIGGQVLESQLQVEAKINNGSYGEVPGIKANNPDWTNLVEIEVISKEPQKAKEALQNIEALILADHSHRLNIQKVTIEKEIVALQADIDSLISRGQQEVASLQLEINNLQKQLETIQPTKIIKEPTISEKPIRPRVLLNTIIAVILGIFLGIFLAFFKEWWDKNKVQS